MKTLPQPRVRPGVPQGGQWTSFEHPESAVSLSDAPVGRSDVAERLARLADEGYSPPIAVRATEDPRSSRHRAQWWDTHFVTAEYGAASGDYPQMPDDFTPNRTGGRALSGNRRTHRMAYRTADDSLTLRMPSATSVKAYEAETGGTFDLPVSAIDGQGRSVSGWVRVTRSGRDWTVSDLGGFGDTTGMQVSEAVSAVLESRRPSRALTQVGDLIARHKARRAAAGAPLTAVPSGFISSVGYDDATGTMAVAIRDRTYGYRVPREVFEAVANSHTPGGVYNRLVKGVDRVGVSRCRDCGRFFGNGAAHVCQTNHKAPPRQVPAHNLAARAAALGHLRRPTDSTTAATGSPRPTPSAGANPSGRHTAAGDDVRAIDLAGELRHLRSEPLQTFGVAENPTHRGWTIASARHLSQFTSAQYVPHTYGTSSLTGDYRNGTNGIYYYDGINGDAAAGLLSSLPTGAGPDSHNGAPAIGSMLRAAHRYPGRVEVGGYLVGPDRADERVSADTLLLYADTDRTADEAWQSAREKLQFGECAEPTEAQLVENPWRPGEKCWRFWWD